MKKIAAFTISAVLVFSLAGCGSAPVATGSKAPEVSTERLGYLAQLKQGVTAADISDVMAFMKTLTAIVGEDVIGEYTTSYDADTETVYVTTKSANIAFRLDSDGNVMFASANGSPSVKSALNQAIAKIYIGTGRANSVENLFDEIEETRWLNSINSNVALKSIESFSMDTLDTTLKTETPVFDTDAYTFSASSGSSSLSTLSSIQRLLSEDLELPVLTTKLESYGVTDLTNYYESPSLSKFWKEVDYSSINSEIDSITGGAKTLQDYYTSLELESPDMEVPEWSKETYKLPSSFSDGTSTTIGKETLDAFNEYQSDLSAWRDELWQKELEAQIEGNKNIQDSNNKGNATIIDKVTENNNSLLEELKNNQAATDKKNDEAASNLENAGSNAWYSSDFKNLYDDTQSKIDSAQNIVDEQDKIIKDMNQMVNDSMSSNQESSEDKYKEKSDELQNDYSGSITSGAKDTIGNALDKFGITSKNNSNNTQNNDDNTQSKTDASQNATDKQDAGSKRQLYEDKSDELQNSYSGSVTSGAKDSLGELANKFGSGLGSIGIGKAGE